MKSKYNILKEEPRENKLLTFYNDYIIPLFEKNGYELPVNVKISIGNTSSVKAIGECWHPRTGQGYYHIYISPKKLKYHSEVLEILIHEAIHTLFFDHKKGFQNCAKAVGLIKPWTATTAGNNLAQDIEKWIFATGWEWFEPTCEGVFLAGKTKKQSTRLIKLECPECGYIIRTSQKNIDEKGFPTCPCGNEFQLTD